MTGYLWDFGDGATSMLANPSHTYAAAGTYTVCLTVVGPCSADSTCQTVVITSCSSPVAGFSVSGTSPTFNFTNSSTTTGNVTYAWDFGDGNNSSLPNPSHTYTTNGTFVVILVVTDSCGGDQISQTVNVSGLGIGELNANTLNVFPNPSKEKVAVETSSAMSYIELIDLSGKTVYSSELNGTQATVDVQSVANGAYILSVQFTDGSNQQVRIEVLK